MPTLRLSTLLADLEGETHAARCRRVVALARSQRGGKELPELLDSLAAQSDYHAILALIAAATASESRLIARLADHPHARVARAARARLPLGDAAQEIVADYLASAPADRRSLRRRLAVENRADVVDALLGHDLADTERAGLLASASAAAAASYLPDLADLIPNLTALAHRHPRLVIDHLRRRITAAPQPVRDHWWAWADRALPRLVAVDPGAVLTLLESDPPAAPPGGIEAAIGALIRHDAHRTARVLTDPRRRLSRLSSGLLRNASRFSPDDRVIIATRLRDDDRELGSFLDALPPSERTATFERTFADLNVAQRIWGDGVLDALPHEVRHREARRILGLPAVRADVQQAMHYAGYLPADAADAVLAERRRAAAAEERASAYVATIRASARSRKPQTLATTLAANLPGLRNEQDPVRLAVADALHQIPPWLLLTAGIDALRDFALTVADARDTSAATLSTLQRTVWDVTREALRRDPGPHVDGETQAADCLRIIDILAGPGGIPALLSFDGVPRGRERIVVEALLPRLRVAADKDDYAPLFRLCSALGSRAWGVRELDDLLERALGAPTDSDVRTAAGLWLADPASASTRVETILSQNESLAVLPLIQTIVSRHRQDLLGVLWKPTPLAGRLWGRRARFVPILDGPFTRWLPAQVRAYADALAVLIATPGVNTWTATRAIRTLGRLPEIGAAAVSEYAGSDDVALREAALAALGRSDDPASALTRLLAVRTGDDTRVTMYAAAQCVRNIPAAEAFPVLADVLSDPASKVTARKEAVRLLGLIRHPAALDLLVGIGLADSTHRDVRIATARTLRAWLDDERAWQVQTRVAELGREGLLALVETYPSLLAERHRVAYARLLVPAALAGEAALVATLGTWSPWLPEAMSLLAGVLADPGRPATTPAQAIRSGLRQGAGWEPVVDVIGHLARRSDEPDQADAQSDSDQPARQRLSLLVTTISDIPRAEMEAHRHHLVRIVDLLTAHPSLRGLTLTAAARAVDWEAPDAGVWRLVGLVDEPLRCADLRSALKAAVPARRELPMPGPAGLVNELIGAGTLAAGAAAVSIVARWGPATTWDPAWRAMLRDLRRHPSAVIAGWARDVVTATDLG